MKIKIKYFEGVKKINKINIGDWIDLRSTEDVDMEEGEYKRLPLGVAMQLPEGYEAIMAPRSSTFEKYGLIMTNSIGVIDESYCGDNDQWHFPALAATDTFIPAGARICQFRIIEHQPEIEFEEVEEFGNDDRGGFGSTGEK